MDISLPTTLAYLLISVTSGEPLSGPIAVKEYPSSGGCLEILHSGLISRPEPYRSATGKYVIKIYGCVPTAELNKDAI